MPFFTSPALAPRERQWNGSFGRFLASRRGACGMAAEDAATLAGATTNGIRTDGRVPTPFRLLVLALALFVSSCSEAERAPGPLGDLGPAPVGDVCDDSAERRCSVTLSQESGTLHCLHGVQTCESGTWGACENGVLRKQVDMREHLPDGSEGKSLLSLSSAVDCPGNPCDPSCQAFLEDPPDLTAMGGASGSSTTFGEDPPDWSSGATLAPCAHELCVLGGALDSTCHPCVARVCDADPSCCSDSGGSDWSAACVGLVHTECAGQAAEPPLPAITACDFSVFGDARLRFVNGGSYLGGPLGSNGTGPSPAVDVSGDATVPAVITNGDVSIASGSTVTGSVTAGGTIANSGSVGGMETESTPLVGVTLPSRPIDCVVADTTTTTLAGQVLSDGDTRVVVPSASGTPTFTFAGPGHFGGFAANGNDARLVFKAPGTYTFATLYLDGGSNIAIEVPASGNVVIEICGASDAVSLATAQVTLVGTLGVSASDGGPADPHQLQIYTNFEDDIPLAASSLDGLTLIAPLGRVYSTGPGGSARGMVLANEVDFVTDIDLSSVGFSGTACEEAGILGPGMTCPISLEVGSMPPTRRPGCLSGEDCQANARCTDVDTAPACSHSKCTEGAALGDSCRTSDPCVARICEIEGACCDASTGWSCLPGNLCVAAQCGDGMVRGLELCDDGNADSADGCSSACRVEPGFVCSGEPSVCVPTACGDGIVEGTEGCDDGALAPWDGCSEKCELEPICPPNGGACSSQCGDGMTLAGDSEDCDDGNLTDGDGCSSACTFETGFSCALQATSTEPFIDLPVVYRDFANLGPSKHPDFETFRGVYPTRGMVGGSLGSDGLPVYTGTCEVGSPIVLANCPNISVWDGYAVATGYMTNSQAAFDQWYRPSAMSSSYWDTIRLDFTTPNYVFAPGNSFYPLTGAPLMAGDGLLWASISSLQNFGFTSEIRHWFEYSGGEVLNFQGDDDVWVFINGQLVLDLGGLHKALAGRITLSGSDAIEEWWDDAGYHTETHPIGLTVGNAYEIALFHAERAAWESNFSLTLSGFFREPSVCTPVCGDGLVVSGEVCDDGTNDGGTGECEPGCLGWDDSGLPPVEWNDTCVELVKTACDAECGAPLGGACEHAACEVGTALDSGCSSCVADVCALPGLSHCCDTSGGSWDAACLAAANEVCAEEGGRACDYAVLGGGTVHLEGVTVAGGLAGGGFVEVTSGADVGDIMASGSVDIQGGSTGAIVSGGSISQSGGSTGAQAPLADVPEFTITARTFACGGTTTTTVASGSPVSLLPGTYPHLTVGDGAELTFSAAGDYFLRSLTVSGTGKLVLPAAGNVNIHVCESLSVQGAGLPSLVGPTMELNGGASLAQADALRVRFFVNGTGSSTIAHYAELYGLFFFANSGVYVGSGASVHGLVHAAGSITTNAGGSINSSGVTGAACTMTQVVSGIEAPALSECDYAMVGEGSMVVVGGTVLGGDVSGGGAVNVQALVTSCEPPLLGTCSYTPEVDGNVQVAGAFAGCGYVTGDCDTNLGVGLTLPTIAQRTFSCPVSGPSVTLSTGDPFPPGAYAAVTVGAGQTISFESGTYTVGSLTINASATIALPDHGTARVDSCGRIHVGSGVATTGATNSSDGLRLQLYSSSTDHTPLPGTRTDNAIYVGKSSTVYATLVAPDGAVMIDDWATVYGFVHASEGMVMSGATLDASGVTGTNCELNEQFGSCQATDVETPTVDGDGICLENGDSYVDAACAGVDLAVDFGCDGIIPVCNHGTTDAPAGTVLTFFPRAGHQFATESPDPSWALGTCTVTDAIPSGQCVSQVCDPDLTDEEVTVVVNVDGAVPECSLLDNWSLSDPAELCPGSYEPLVFEEVYEASCPAGSRPGWGLLTWHSQTPGSTNITFEGRLAGSESSLDAQAYLPLGTAAQTPVDTQDCPYLSVLPECPVDLLTVLTMTTDSFSSVTDAMTGERAAVSYLELRISLTPELSETPILEDWNVTYSCLFDE